MISELCRVGAIVGGAIATASTSCLANAVSSIGTDQLVASIVGGGTGAVIAYLCIKHIIENVRYKDAEIRRKDDEIKRLNRIINNIKDEEENE